MTYRIIIEPTAGQGMREAVRWKTANASPALAARWYYGLARKINTLKSHPTRCLLAVESDKCPGNIRERLYGKRRNTHRIIFTLQADSVRALYLENAARDELEA